MSTPITLPPDLYSRTLTQFDDLQSRGLLFYQPSKPEYLDDNDFKFQFRISPSFTKPILSPTDPGRHHAGGPFSNPEAEFIVTTVGATHLLQLNKFCILRPSLILHPIEFKEQTTDLDESDVEGAWSLLGEFEQSSDKKFMVIYNCGSQAGASQGHKHLQILPRPERDEFEMFPDRTDVRVQLSVDQAINIPTIPFKHHLTLLPPNATSQNVFSQYQKALAKTKQTLKENGNGSEAYNVLFVKEWMILVPRRSKGREGVGANSVGMMGMVWLKDDEERKCWEEEGLGRYLMRLGVPN